MEKKKLRYQLEMYDGDTLLRTIDVRIGHRPQPSMAIADGPIDCSDFRYEWDCWIPVVDESDEKQLSDYAMRSDKLRLTTFHGDKVWEEWTMPQVKLQAFTDGGVLFYGEEATDLVQVEWTHGSATWDNHGMDFVKEWLNDNNQ